MWKEKIMQEFPGALPGPEVTRKIISFLSAQGFTPDNTIFSNSTCPDEINRKKSNIFLAVFHSPIVA